MRRFSILIALTAAAGLLGCPSLPPDLDDTPTKPDLPRVSPGIEVADSLDVGKKDLSDWKTVTAFEKGTGKITLIVGNPFGGDHRLTGEVGVYPTSGPPALAKAAITPGEHNYELTFDTEADTTYLVQIAATKGDAPYKISFSVEAAPVDPCAGVKCGDDEECQQGECVKIEVEDSGVCSPKCARGLICVDGSCVKPCDGGCKRGEYCNRATNTCVRDACYGKTCPAGQRCRGGRCVDVAPPPATGCAGGCAAGEKCVGDKCVAQAEAPPEPGGPIAASVVQIIPQGKKTVLVLNRGKTHGVVVGATGKISGVAGTFKVTEVYAFRSKAVIDLDDKAIGNARSASINR